jgi:TolA-binding protein
MKPVLRWCAAVLLLSALSLAQSGSSAKPASDTSNTPAGITENDVKELREALAAQQKQIAAQQQQIKQQQEMLERLSQTLATQKGSQAAQSQAASQPGQPAPNLGQVASTTPIIPAGVAASTSAAPKIAEVSEGQVAGSAPKQQASDSIELASGKVKIGALAYADYAYYYNTGFGPQFLTQTNFAGAGNDSYNAFEVSRTYLNMVYSPNDFISFRITPNIYRQFAGVTNDKVGKVGAVPASADGNLTFRLKYGYAEMNAFRGSEAFHDDNIRFGQQMNPLVDWQEGLYGFRYVNLVPWNYLSLSSTYTGASLNGPIKVNGKQYVDYQIGVFNDANFHVFNQSETKTGMARVSFYPFGASSKYEGLGITGFVDYGYGNTAPDTATKVVERMAGLVHYTTPHNGYQLAAEYDFGRNAFSLGNLFSGAGPQDAFGLGTTQFAGLTDLATAILAGTHTRQKGFDVFGHADIPNTKFTLFGMYEFFQPNTNIPKDPIDFHRLVLGINYTYNKHLRFAVDSQNVLYRYSQFTYPASSLAQFSSKLAKANPNGIAKAVPPNVQSIFLNMEFSF